tara:strand:- start:1955 stop:2320 length:366 start_codon:yes stop_codon:yes gene_type:complete
MACVMIVDDSPTDILNLKNILQKAGHTVVEATNGAEAIGRIRQSQPDCVLMDVVMPGINGFQATRTLSRDPLTSSIPIIVCSSKNQETDRVWAMRQGAREYLVKPVKEYDLLKKISSVLAA